MTNEVGGEYRQFTLNLASTITHRILVIIIITFFLVRKENPVFFCYL